MGGFRSWRSYNHFESEVAYKARYVWSDTTDEFIREIRRSAPSKEFQTDTTDEFWRAVAAISEPTGMVELFSQAQRPCSPDRIMPLRYRAHEGRVNPKGIPCVYAATNPGTAISEVRPALGAYLTLAKLMPVRALRLVDCSNHEAPSYDDEPDDTAKDEAVWGEINRAFSRPVNRSDDSADYAPTQILAEVFRDMGYDGLAYRSAFGEDGFNVAFFDTNAVSIEGTWVYRVKNISHDAEVVPQVSLPGSSPTRVLRPPSGM